MNLKIISFLLLAFFIVPSNSEEFKLQDNNTKFNIVNTIIKFKLAWSFVLKYTKIPKDMDMGINPNIWILSLKILYLTNHITHYGNIAIKL